MVLIDQEIYLVCIFLAIEIGSMDLLEDLDIC